MTPVPPSSGVSFADRRHKYGNLRFRLLLHLGNLWRDFRLCVQQEIRDTLATPTRTSANTAMLAIIRTLEGPLDFFFSSSFWPSVLLPRLDLRRRAAANRPKLAAFLNRRYLVAVWRAAEC